MRETFREPPQPLLFCNADPEIVRANVNRGVDAVRPRIDEAKEELPKVKMWELLELPALALALGFGANKVFTPASPQEIRARQSRQRPARRLTLTFLEIAAELGLVPAATIRKIREGKGGVNEARDGIDIVAVFNEFSAALANKHPFPQTMLDTLAGDSNWLVAQLLPKGAVPEKAERNPDAVIRDQLWTELDRRHDELYKVGVILWGPREVDNHIPSLHSRVVTSASSEGTTSSGTPAKPGSGESQGSPGS